MNSRRFTPMSFEEFLESKKIDPKEFGSQEPDTFSQWQKEFDQMHPRSFLSQKLYLINPVRRRFQLKTEKATPDAKPVTASKPVMKPRTGAAVAKPKVKIPASGSKPVIKKPLARKNESDTEG